MSASDIRADYEKLQAISQRFAAASTKVRTTLERLEQTTRRLRESWQGKAATAFHADINRSTFPAMRRLASALQEAGQQTARMSVTLNTAEQEAARLFKGGNDASTPPIRAFAPSDGQVILAQYQPTEGNPTPVNPDDDPSLLNDTFDGMGVAAPANMTRPDATWIDDILDFKMPWWLELGLGALVVGDLLDLAREQVLKRLAGRDPDSLVTALAGLGLAAELGHLLPTPGVEDGANVAIAALKTIAKNLPTGPARDRLAEMVESAVRNPDEMARLAKLAEAFAGNSDLFLRLLDNPNAMHAVLNGGVETFEVLARHGDDAMRAANNLAGNAPRFLQYYDELAGVPGADNILRDLGSTSPTTVTGAMGELQYFSTIRGELGSVGLVDSAGRKAADALLTNGTVVDVKNWNLYKPFYNDPVNIQRSIAGVQEQVARYRELYPNAPAIRYVFNQPASAMHPTMLKGLQDLGIEVVFTR
jgi:WXG100 family type VII secretion target